MKISKSRIAFNIVNYTLLALIGIICVYPIIYVFAASMSSAKFVNMGNVWLVPKGFTLAAYEKIIAKNGIWMSYFNSFYYMIFGTIVNLIVTICGAYPLSKKDLDGARVINMLIAFTMWFSAGTIPLYLTFREYGMINTRAAIIFGFACGAYNFILLRTYFAGIPQAIEEAARIDGASDLYTLVKIVLPLSLPSLATIGLFYAVSRWNGYLWTMILLTDDSKIPLQVVLKKLVVDMTGHAENMNYDKDVAQNLSEETVMYATMVFAIVPMMLLYPFIQKYFVKGIMLGSVKG